MNENFEKIVNSDFVTKAYVTPDNKFLKVETKNGVVYTIWAKHDGYQMTSPIQPNHRTGSSTCVMGEGDYDYGSFDDVMIVIENGTKTFPNFFSREYREATKFLTIEQSVAIHGNILQFNKIK